jgi:hypothetical protein
LMRFILPSLRRSSLVLTLIRVTLSLHHKAQYKMCRRRLSNKFIHHSSAMRCRMSLMCASLSLHLGLLFPAASLLPPVSDNQ